MKRLLAIAALLLALAAPAHAQKNPGAVTLTASEDLAAGALVNIWDNSGRANVRNASARDAMKPAEGFVRCRRLLGERPSHPGAKVTGDAAIKAVAEDNQIDGCAVRMKFREEASKPARDSDR